MNAHDIFDPASTPARLRPAGRASVADAAAGGRFDLVCEDRAGAWSGRRLAAPGLELGPGRTIPGGIDAARGGCRGFRVDRILRLTDHTSGERVEAGILDRLLAGAEAQRRAEAALIRRRTRARRAAPADSV